MDRAYIMEQFSGCYNNTQVDDTAIVLYERAKLILEDIAKLAKERKDELQKESEARDAAREGLEQEDDQQEHSD